MTVTATKRGRWVRPATRCPGCGKHPGLRVDEQLARLVAHLVAEHDVAGAALSAQCNRCRTKFEIPFADVAHP